MAHTPATGPLVVACGALAGELRSVLDASGLSAAVEVVYLPAHLHNRPERIVPTLLPPIDAALAEGRTVLVAYADCGTGGLLDAALATRRGVTRLPGAHCYEMFAGAELFAALHDARPGTFYLTDYLARHFDALVWAGLGLDRHPQLRDLYFGHYTHVVHLAQGDDAHVRACAVDAAARLRLELETHHVGRAGLDRAVRAALLRTHEVAPA